MFYLNILVIFTFFFEQKFLLIFTLPWLSTIFDEKLKKNNKINLQNQNLSLKKPNLVLRKKKSHFCQEVVHVFNPSTQGYTKKLEKKEKRERILKYYFYIYFYLEYLEYPCIFKSLLHNYYRSIICCHQTTNHCSFLFSRHSITDGSVWQVQATTYLLTK